MIATGYGSGDVLKLTETKIPQAGEEEVLIRVYASSATRADIMMLTGKPYFARLFTGLTKPRHAIPGTGFAGEIVATGSKVTRFKKGDAVFGETTLGFSTNAQYVAVPENGVIQHKPENLSFAEACTWGDGHLTSINFLREIGKVRPGMKVLVNGASGSLGTAAVQIAKYYGATVTGVCSTTNTGLVRSLGADEVIDYTRENFTDTPDTYDLIFDTVGKSSFSRSRKALRKNGVYLSPVMKFSLLLRMIFTSFGKGKKAMFAATGLKSDQELRELLSELLRIHAEGHLQTHIDRQYPLEKLARAHAYVARGHKKGNVIIHSEN